MPQAFAYCEEAKKNITLDEAHDLYFKQPEEKRKRLNFRCGDPLCRGMQQPLVVAALYDRKDEPGEKPYSPYYRGHKAHPHINNCTWVNSENNSGASKKDETAEVRSTASVLTEFGLVFKIKRPKSREKGGDSGPGSKDVPVNENNAEEEENEEANSGRPLTTRFMAYVASTYLRITVQQRRDYTLSIEGICKAPFYNVCLPISTFHPHFQKERIFHGRARVVELDHVFLIQYFQKMSPSGNKEKRTTPPEIKLLKRWLDGNDRALAAVLHDIAESKGSAWCFFYTTEPPNLIKNKAQFTIDDPNLIAVLGETEITVLEPPAE